MRVLAIDYGRVNTGTAISDATGSVVRPLEEVSDAAGEAGLRRLLELVQSEDAEMVIVGMPVSLSGERGEQARETQMFLKALEEILPVSVNAWDERFTSKMAAEKGRHSKASQHSIAACCLLEDYLRSSQPAPGGDSGHGSEGPEKDSRDSGDRE